MPGSFNVANTGNFELGKTLGLSGSIELKLARVYDRIVTGPEVVSLYNDGKPTSFTTADSNIMAEYLAENSSSTTWYDTSGNEYNAAAAGNPVVRKNRGLGGENLYLSGNAYIKSKALLGDSDSLAPNLEPHRFSGHSIFHATPQEYFGNYGSFILNANSNATGDARRYLITNAFNRSNFAIIRSVNATTDPTIGDDGALSSGVADLVMDNNGKVGIGKTAPSAKLDVYNSISNASESYTVANIYGYDDSPHDTSHTITGLKVETNPAGSGYSNVSEIGLHVKIRGEQSAGNPIAALFENGNVGIGVTPDNRLHIKQSSDDLTGGIKIESTGTESAFIYRMSDEDDSLVLRNNGVDTLFIKDGNLGIRETAPAHSLSIKQTGDSSTNNLIRLTHDNITDADIWFGTYNSSSTVTAYQGNTVLDSFAPVIVSSSNSSGYVSLGAGRTGTEYEETLRLQKTKAYFNTSLGIGTTDPTGFFEVVVDDGVGFYVENYGGTPRILAYGTDLFLGGNSNVQVTNNLLPSSGNSVDLGNTNRYWRYGYIRDLYVSQSLAVGKESADGIFNTYSNSAADGDGKVIFEQSAATNRAAEFNLLDIYHGTDGVGGGADYCKSSITFSGDNTATTPEKFTMAKLISGIEDASDGLEAGYLAVNTMYEGSLSETYRFDGRGKFTVRTDQSRAYSPTALPDSELFLSNLGTGASAGNYTSITMKVSDGGTENGYAYITSILESATHHGTSLALGVRRRDGNYHEVSRFNNLGYFGLNTTDPKEMLHLNEGEIVMSQDHNFYFNAYHDGGAKYVDDGHASKFTLNSSGSFLVALANENTSGSGASLTWIDSLELLNDGSAKLHNIPSGSTSSFLIEDNGIIKKKTPSIVVPHTWTISGEIKVPSGDDDFINPFFVPVPSGQSVKLKSMTCKINSGTSATIKLQKNDADITGFTGVSVTDTAAATDPSDVSITDGDKLQVVVTGVTGTPKNMTVTLFMEYSL